MCVYAISVTIAICICHIIVCTVIHCYLLRHLSLLDCPLLVFVTSMSFRIVIYCCSLRHLYALYDIPCSCGSVPGDVPGGGHPAPLPVPVRVHADAGRGSPALRQDVSGVQARPQCPAFHSSRME